LNQSQIGSTGKTPSLAQSKVRTGSGSLITPSPVSYAVLLPIRRH
jgi:hypothetical protein